MSERNAKGKTPEDYGFRMPNKKGIQKFELHEGASVKKVIGIVSGKGGVGKSFVTSILAAMMQKRNHRVAVLDGDITGPSQGKSFGVTSKAEGFKGTIYPAITKNGMQLISSNMLLDKDDEGKIVVRTGDELYDSYGQPTERILEDIMGLKTTRNQEIFDKLEKIREMVNEDKYETDDFKKEYGDLKEILGTMDEDVMLIDMEIQIRRKGLKNVKNK